MPKMHRNQFPLAALAFLAPFLALLIAFMYVPIAAMVLNSFESYNLLNPSDSTFVGLDNYARALADPLAAKSLVVTITFALALVLIEIPLGLGFALIVNRAVRGIAFVRGSVFAPVVTSVVVVATMWTFLLEPVHGLINNAVSVVGLGPFDFLTSKSEALPSLIAMTLWQQVGFSMVLFLAGLQAIPTDFYDAAAIDGANARQRFWYVTRPLLGRTTVLVVVVMSVFAFQAFAPAYIMTEGGPQSSTLLFVFYIYKQAFSFLDPGYASALSVVIVALIMVISVVQMRSLRTNWRY